MRFAVVRCGKILRYHILILMFGKGCSKVAIIVARSALAIISKSTEVRRVCPKACQECGGLTLIVDDEEEDDSTRVTRF